MSKLTPKFLKSCTDEQINKGVGWIEASKRPLAGRCNWCGEMKCVHRANFLERFSYCANPNDAWPIMMNNLISTTPRGRSSYAQPYASSGMLAIMVHCDSNEELLRAAMEVYILMEVGK